jgi:ribosomal protein S13
VLNEKEVKHSFLDQRTLSEEQIQRIVHQLTEKCRIEGEKRKRFTGRIDRPSRSRRNRSSSHEPAGANIKH